MSILFEPIRINKITLKNRIVKSATIENMATIDGLPTDKTARFYLKLAKGGCGLIIPGYAYVNKTGQSYPLQNGAHSDMVIDRWKTITDDVHKYGSKIALQIVHGGRQTKKKSPWEQRPACTFGNSQHGVLHASQSNDRAADMADDYRLCRCGLAGKKGRL